MKHMLAVLLAIGVLVWPVGTAQADEEYICWYVESLDPVAGTSVTIMRCRINGVIVDGGFPPGGPEDVTLVYDVGYDAVGECYYRRTGAWSGWIADGVPGERMNFWWDPDAVPGGPVVGDLWLDPCTSEPTPGEPPLMLAYQLIESYDFVDPDPVVVPDGIGLAGLQSYVALAPPEPAALVLVSPITGARIEAEIRVATVSIDWGDGTVVTIPESQFDLLAAYPEGKVGHVWETKGKHVIAVDYNWSVRWRVEFGPWNNLDVPATEWSAPYRVDEVVGRRNG